MKHFSFDDLKFHFMKRQQIMLLISFLQKYFEFFLAKDLHSPSFQNLRFQLYWANSVDFFVSDWFSQYPAAIEFLYFNDGINLLHFLSQLPHFLPELFHVLFLRRIFVENVFPVQNWRQISSFAEWLNIICEYRLFFFLRNDHIIVNSNDRSLGGKKVPGQKGIFITPKSHPNNGLRQWRIQRLIFWIKDTFQDVHIKLVLMEKHELQVWKVADVGEWW